PLPVGGTARVAPCTVTGGSSVWASPVAGSRMGARPNARATRYLVDERMTPLRTQQSGGDGAPKPEQANAENGRARQPRDPARWLDWLTVLSSCPRWPLSGHHRRALQLTTHRVVATTVVRSPARPVREMGDACRQVSWLAALAHRLPLPAGRPAVAFG